jgi:hypothetical protein
MTTQRQDVAKKLELVLADNTVYVDEKDEPIIVDFPSPAMRK